MPGSTDMAKYLIPDLQRVSGVTSWSQPWAGDYLPVEKLPDETIQGDPNLPSNILLTYAQTQQRKFEAPIPTIWPPVGADSIPLQIWEGTVLQIDKDAGVMRVMLVATKGNVPRHTTDIDLEWVSEQDEDLVQPGAVFYLTLFKRTKRGSIENSQELRFRRRPSWSKTQLVQVEKGASELLGKMRALPSAE